MSGMRFGGATVPVALSAILFDLTNGRAARTG